MSYNNYNSGYGGYSRSGYNNGYNGGYNRSFNGSSGPRRQYNNAQPKKHSGCQWRENFTAKSGERKAACMFGWNYSRQRGGLVKFVAGPAKDTTVNNKSGKDLSKWVAKITWPDGRSETKTAFLNRDTKKLTIPDMGMVANPLAPNGGYFGKAFRTKN